MTRHSFLSSSGEVFRIVRYYAVGVLINGVGYAAFLLCLQVGMGHILAASLLYIGGTLLSFWLNRAFVFHSTAMLRSSFVRLILMLLAGYVLNVFSLYVFVDLWSLDARLVQLCSVVVVSIFFYVMNKFFVHRSF